MLPETPTQPAVSNALALDRMMRERNLETPYEFVSEPPEDYAKLRRHKNAKYRFEPAPDHVPPPI
jgi:site-specific DNA recombinase